MFHSLRYKEIVLSVIPQGNFLHPALVVKSYFCVDLDVVLNASIFFFWIFLSVQPLLGSKR